VSFAAITLCVTSQRVSIVVYLVSTQSGNFWIHPRIKVTDLFLIFNRLCNDEVFISPIWQVVLFVCVVSHRHTYPLTLFPEVGPNTEPVRQSL
jgi:hypothetical protein